MPKAGWKVGDKKTIEEMLEEGVPLVNTEQVSVDGQDLPVEKVGYEPGMTNFVDGLSDEEIHRFVLEAGEQLELERIELRMKGGGSSTDVSIDVYDATNSTTIDSVDAGNTSLDGGTSNSGVTILVRITNASGSAQDVSPIVRGLIK